jgi:succinate dehydrogenase/fumarate reductase cytochrome b subunit
MLNSFFRKLANELRQFVAQQIVVGLAVAVTISLNQFRTGQLSASGLRTDLWHVALPYLLIVVIAILFHSVRTLYLMIKDLQQSQSGSVVLTDTESEAGSRSQAWIAACLVMILFGLLGFFLSNRLRPSQRWSPPPPTLLAASVEYDWEAGEQKGRLSQAPSFSPCFERGAKVFSLNDLSLFPGGPNSKRPWLVFRPTRYSYIYLPAQPDYYDLMFEVSLVNRGEASIAKDWSLCILQGKHRIASRLSGTPATRKQCLGIAILSEILRFQIRLSMVTR